MEITQSVNFRDRWGTESNLASAYTLPLLVQTSSSGLEPRSSLSGGTPQQSTPSTSPETYCGRDSTQEASWASLQRALSAANAARDHFAHDDEQCVVSVPSAENVMHPSEVVPGRDMPHDSTLSDWASSTTSSTHWAESHPCEERPFDFGFDQQPHNHHSEAETFNGSSPTQVPAPTYAVSSDMWSNSVQMPTLIRHPSREAFDLQGAQTLLLPMYPTSRRDSSSSDLAQNFGNFALTGTSASQSPTMATSDAELHQTSESEIDLAGRRNRPRPAALGTAALRSRSYGASPSISPTLRFGGNPHAVRHVKSTGQNLNVRYAGIRKPSSAQRSPLNIATFAEAEEFNRFMTEQSGIGQARTANHAVAPPVQHRSHTQASLLSEAFFNEHDQENASLYHPSQPLNLNMTPPPTTPNKQDFLFPGQMQSIAPPLSAPPQHAIFPNYTPPYSAGPLTGSSSSDAPLTSPEHPSFPSAFPATVHMPQATYPMVQGFGASPFHPFSFPPEPKMETVLPGNAEPKPTEFFIQEFPRQKEEHAHAAQQLAAQKPKNYVFANATPNDF